MTRFLTILILTLIPASALAASRPPIGFNPDGVWQDIKCESPGSICVSVKYTKDNDGNYQSDNSHTDDANEYREKCVLAKSKPETYRCEMTYGVSGKDEKHLVRFLDRKGFYSYFYYVDAWYRLDKKDMSKWTKYIKSLDP